MLCVFVLSSSCCARAIHALPARTHRLPVRKLSLNCGVTRLGDVRIPSHERRHSRKEICSQQSSIAGTYNECLISARSSLLVPRAVSLLAIRVLRVFAAVPERTPYCRKLPRVCCGAFADVVGPCVVFSVSKYTPSPPGTFADITRTSCISASF